MGICASKEEEGQRLGGQTERVARPVNKKTTKTEGKQREHKKHNVDTTKGYTLSSPGIEEEKENKETPREAARRAAAERMEKQAAGNGALGEKLAREKARSNTKQLQTLSEQQLRAREIETKPVYD